MRILHSSDWHLGRTLHRTPLREAQERFVDALVATVRSERVDVVVVAGDVYDRAVPPVEAVLLLEEALARLVDAGARVVISSGNHDSATRLGFGHQLVAAAGVHLRTRPDQLATPVVVEDDHGPVAFYPLPYLEPAAVRSQLPPLPDQAAADGDPSGDGDGHPGGGAARRGHGAVLRHACACVAADAARRGLRRTVVAAHAWVTGGQGCDSERDITVGGVAAVPAELFTPFSYTALGHLHGPQVIGEAVRYSGSPLPYSFSEAGQVKGWWLVELDGAGLARVEQVPAPVYRRLSLLRGELQQLLTSAAHTERERDFVAVTLTDAARPVEAMERLRRRFPHVLTVAWEPPDGGERGGSYGARLAGRDDAAVTREFVEHVRRTPTTETERELLDQALEAARRGADGEGR